MSNTIMLDEPVNGLDPDGILWIRDLLKNLAGEGRTVFVSSHLMSEMEQTADHLIIIGRGRILADETMESFIASASGQTVRVTSPESDQIARMMLDYRARTDTPLEVIYPTATPSTLDILGVPAPQVGELCRQNSFVVHELRTVAASLEDAFMDITQKSLQFHAQTVREGSD